MTSSRTGAKGRGGVLLLACLAVCLFVTPARASGQGVTIAAAADLQYVMPVLTERFQRETGRQVTVTYGSSGNFFSQIKNGAPFDLLFSADIEYPRRLEAEGLVEPGSLLQYAIGRIVIWFRRDRPLDAARGMQSLADARIRRIAIANPDHAPYGRAAVAALQHAGIYDRVRSKLIRGENVAQAAQFVESGNADAGIIALSLALAPALKRHGEYVDVPLASYPALAQAAVVIKASRNKQAALAFLAFVRTPDAVSLMSTFGFSMPAAAGAGR